MKRMKRMAMSLPIFFTLIPFPPVSRVSHQWSPQEYYRLHQLLLGGPKDVWPLRIGDGKLRGTVRGTQQMQCGCPASYVCWFVNPFSVGRYIYHGP